MTAQYLKVYCAILLIAYPAGLRAAENNVSSCDFKRLFHRLVKNVSTTTLRKELKVVVPVTKAEEFLGKIEKILGDDKQINPSLKKMGFREQPESIEEQYFTQTDYLPKFIGRNDDNAPQFNAVIRIRNYLIAPIEMTSKEIENSPHVRLQPLVDQPGVYAKLEFKMGHTEIGHDGIEREVPGVVQKPTITLLRSDIDLLLTDLRTYEENKNAILKRARELTFTRGANTTQVNNSAELEEMVKRIGEIHRSGFSLEKLAPAYQTLYQRTARKISFHPTTPEGATEVLKPFEAQLTIDRDVRVKQYENSGTGTLAPEDRIIELKIPTAYAEMPEETLAEYGLSDLATIRKLYHELTPSPGTQKGQGKRSLTKPPVQSK